MPLNDVGETCADERLLSDVTLDDADGVFRAIARHDGETAVGGNNELDLGTPQKL